MELKQLEYFLACAKHASLTLAAEELYTTQPHVSIVIKSLELELGVNLFHRKSKGVELTEDGKRIYTYAVNAMKNTNLITSISREKKGPCLRIATNPSSNMAGLLTHYYEKKKVDSFHLHYTECGIEEMIALISCGEYDLGFLFAPDHKRSALFRMLERRQLKFVPLLATDLVLYVGSSNPLYGMYSVTPKQLLEFSFIQFEDDFFAIEDLLDDLPEFHTKKQALTRLVHTNSDHMMIQMLRETQLCNLGSYWLKDMYRQYNFGRILIEGFEKKISFGYLKHRASPINDYAEGLLDFITKTLRQDIM